MNPKDTHMHIDEAFPSKYLKASELQGRHVTVVISNADIEKIGDDKKLVLYFQGKKKGLVTNKTNATRIADIYGNDTNEWIGREIVLYPTEVDYQGKTVEAIRVKPPTAAAKNSNGKPPVKHVVEHKPGHAGKPGFAMSSMQPADGIEEATGYPTRDPADETEIPF